MKSSALRYCFTLNNYTDEEVSSIEESIRACCKYGIFGFEVGESGTPHLQGFVIFLKRSSFDTAKNRLNPRCHVEVANGSPRQNRQYCQKAGNFREFGECPKGGASNGHARHKSESEGTRPELALSLRESIRSGRRGLVGWADEHPGTWIFSGHALLRNALTIEPPIERPNVKCSWYYGPPGVGKSRKAHELYPDAYVKDPRTKWWNGYLLETDVIMDDLGPGGIDINHLLRWFDRYKCYVETKGGQLPLYGVNFVVTSNFHPMDVYKGTYHINQARPDESLYHPQLPALMRRIELIEFN